MSDHSDPLCSNWRSRQHQMIVPCMCCLVVRCVIEYLSHGGMTSGAEGRHTQQHTETQNPGGERTDRRSAVTAAPTSDCIPRLRAPCSARCP